MLRLHTFSSPAGTFTYNYTNATGRLIVNLALPGGSKIAYGYDPAGLLTSTVLRDPGDTVVDSYGYTYDTVGWRTNVLRADSSHVAYGYDSLGQLTSAQGFESGGTPRYNENFGYTYDPAGNLTQRVNDTLNQTFTVDPANELTNVLRTTTVMTVAGGLTNTPTSLSINGQTVSIYGDKTFVATNVALVDGVNIFTNVLTISGSSYTNQLTKNLPASANLSYDLNGNMTSDGLHSFEYDCANQLTRVTQTNKFKSEFVYDGFGRRRIRREYAWTGSWVPTSETHYVYDGMLVIQERDGSNATKVSYTRGLDLSGSDQGAGGIGGLLARTDASGSAFYHTDGGGNVTAMVNSSGTVVAKYLYDAYGNVLDKTGSLADANLYRFSSKEAHVPTGLYYYGFRYYEPNLQRWINRDPIAERGGLNLFEFVGNDPKIQMDPLGLNFSLWIGDGPLYDKWKIVAPPPSTPLQAAQDMAGDNFFRDPIPFPKVLFTPGNWNYNAFLGVFSSPNWLFNPRCNLFVADCIGRCPLRQAPLIDDGKGGRRIPTAEEWGNPNIAIPGFGPPHQHPKPGDIVTNGHHLGIMSTNGYIEAPTFNGPVMTIPFDNNRGFQPDTGRTPL